MFTFLLNFFQSKGIETVAPLPLSACSIQKSYLLERAGIADGTAFLLAVPYFTPACANAGRNLSAYAVSRDYHGFFEEIFGELLPLLREKYPNERFACFADHSPINERDAAARAGIGVIGKNGMLITEKYSSYVFLGEVITSAKPDGLTVHPLQSCENCGKCMTACPMEDCGSCLSALTQKKGDLTEREHDVLIRYGSVWGCDICQEVCPHTRRALKEGSIYTQIPYFYEKAVSHLTVDLVNGMSDEDFSARAYAWRGRNTILRNLTIAESAKRLENS